MDDQKIDKILEVFVTHDSVVKEGVIRLKAGLVDNKLIDKVIVLGLVEVVDKTEKLQRRLTLTLFGHEVVRHGSWTIYLAEKESEQIANRKLVALSIRTNKLQEILLWFTVGLTAITLFISILDYRVHREELRLEQNRLLQTGQEGQPLEQNTKTVLPSSDSSASYVSDSLP